MTKEEFRLREALYKHLLKLKVPEVWAELIALRTKKDLLGKFFAHAFDHVDCIFWLETPEGNYFWSEIFWDLRILAYKKKAKAGGAA